MTALCIWKSYMWIAEWRIIIIKEDLRSAMTGIAEVKGSNPVQAWMFFRLFFLNCKSYVYTVMIFVHIVWLTLGLKLFLASSVTGSQLATTTEFNKFSKVSPTLFLKQRLCTPA